MTNENDNTDIASFTKDETGGNTFCIDHYKRDLQTL